MDFVTFIGTTGATVILIAFALNQLKKWKDDYFIYDLFNLLGGSLLVIYALILESWPFVVLNIVWSALSLRDVITGLKRNSQKTSKNFVAKWLK